MNKFQIHKEVFLKNRLPNHIEKVGKSGSFIILDNAMLGHFQK